MYWSGHKKWCADSKSIKLPTMMLQNNGFCIGSSIKGRLSLEWCNILQLEYQWSRRSTCLNVFDICTFDILQVSSVHCASYECKVNRSSWALTKRTVCELPVEKNGHSVAFSRRKKYLCQNIIIKIVEILIK